MEIERSLKPTDNVAKQQRGHASLRMLPHTLKYFAKENGQNIAEYNETNQCFATTVYIEIAPQVKSILELKVPKTVQQRAKVHK